MLSNQLTIWILFNILVLAMLALDLGVFHRKSKVIHTKEAIIWSIIWTVIALLFNVWIFFWRGRVVALEFFTGYLIERSLSVDNIFVFLLIFTQFAVPAELQYRVLFWGVIGALVMRATMIGAGVVLIREFHWIIYIFGLFLAYTGIRMAFREEHEIHPEKNPVIKLFGRFFPTTTNYEGDHFFIKRNGRLFATPLFVVLLMIETTDLVFALDSIPAIFAITTDPFIIYTSNVFAILGLRALYFALAAIIELFHYLRIGLSVVLVFVGVKMTISNFYHIPIGISLGVIALVIIASIIISVLKPPPPTAVEVDIAQHPPTE